MEAQPLWDWAKAHGINLDNQSIIVDAGVAAVLAKHGGNLDFIKQNLDQLVLEAEAEAYRIYLEHEAAFCAEVFQGYGDNLVELGEIDNLSELGAILGRDYRRFDRFFLSLGQSRKSRSGSGFERINRGFLEALGYPFTFQPVIDGRPDFVLPSTEHYKANAMDCFTFTAKRTLRERWKQITTEGAHGLGFFLATIDDKISKPQLEEMKVHRINVVCPAAIKERAYPTAVNVLSYRQFLDDHLDPAMERWRRNGVIPASS